MFIHTQREYIIIYYVIAPVFCNLEGIISKIYFFIAQYHIQNKIVNLKNRQGRGVDCSIYQINLIC